MKHTLSKSIIGLALAAGIFLPLAGQEPEPATLQEPAESLVLTLQGAVDHAISYNKSLRNARMEVEKSRASVWDPLPWAFLRWTERWIT